MNILLLGASGRLGRRLLPRLVAMGHDVHAPTREECCATNTEDVIAALDARPNRVVISLVAKTDVPGCEFDPRSAEADNHHAANVVAKWCADADVPFLWVSSDYVLAGGPTPAKPIADPMSFGRLALLPRGTRAYAESKNRGEAAVLAHNGTIARVAFADPEDVEKWTWIDGYGMASREWVEQTAARIAILATEYVARGSEAGEIIHVGPIRGIDDGKLGPWRTHFDLVRDRMPRHPCLRRVAWCPEDRRLFGANEAPGDTRFADCDSRLALPPDARPDWT